jgi:hypothetical protein
MESPFIGGTPSSYEVFRSTIIHLLRPWENDIPRIYGRGPDPSSTYYYKVKAIDNAGSSSIYSNTVSKAPEEGTLHRQPQEAHRAYPQANNRDGHRTTSRTAFGTVEYGKTAAYGYAGSETTATKTIR